jgi:hypothetical protein
MDGQKNTALQTGSARPYKRQQALKYQGNALITEIR